MSKWTKEYRAAYMKEYAKKNRHKYVHLSRKWQKKNKDKVRATQQAREERTLLDYYVIYYLPNEHYCGVSNNPKRRMDQHKAMGKDIEGWKVLQTAETKIEALAIECEFHLMGMNGHIEMSKENNK